MYESIREGVAANASRISVGRNLYPPSKVIQQHVQRHLRRLTESSRISEYESHDDLVGCALVADLLNMYLERSDIVPADVFFTQGSQEGISLMCGYAAQLGLEALLPLPTYYSFEQSSLRWGMPVAGYYRSDGAIWWAHNPCTRIFQALVVPNAITGTMFPVPDDGGSRLGSQVAFTLIDCVFQLGAFDNHSVLTQQTVELVRKFRLEHSALLFTVSKDLSLPALRAGILLTKNRDAMRFAKADRFERLYSISPFSAPIVALYLSVLLLNKCPSCQTYNDVFRAFQNAGVEFLREPEAQEIMTHITEMTRRSQNNLDLLLHGTFPLELTRDFVPIAGFSVFPRVLQGFTSSGKFIDWIKTMGINQGLKINPNYLFGAKPEIWEELYPADYRIRVNLSADTDELRRSLRQLKRGMNLS